MSAFIDRAIEEAGLASIAAARRSGDLVRLRALAVELGGVALLPLGALADRIRAELLWRPRLDDLDTIVRSALAWEERLLRDPW